MGTASLLKGHENGHDHWGAAHEDARNCRFRRAFGGDHRQIEADHADGREQGEAAPLARVEPAQGHRATPADQRQEQDAGETVAEELATRIRVEPQDAVGGEGASDEDAGEGGEQRAPGGGVHDGDAMKGRGPV
ncbi:hypothetical protein GCM10011579_009090 [Streptomyces albiflavescens]|uniref:Uncharacterized protein n=1 Tax=Streptomyces albiflavescens TaxID=1623582 RepID=A0A918CZH7_9ACTN|nr:hypothetical protein GCM10011579_009090 [Streptomyces albiflavescens]